MLWLALGASFFFLARLGEIFANTEGHWDDEHILRRRDVVLFRGSSQVDWTMGGQTDSVEVRLRSSKGDKLRDGTMMTRSRAGPPLSLREVGRAVELIVQLLSPRMFLPSHALRSSFGTARGN